MATAARHRGCPTIKMMTPFQKTYREKLAVHEAAHAVALIERGLTEYMTDLRLEVPAVWPPEAAFPKEGLVTGYLQLAKQPSFPNGTTDPGDLDLIERLSLVYLAAKPAEMRYFRERFPDWSEEQFAGQRWPSGNNDVIAAIRTAAATRAGENLARIRAFIRQTWQNARAFVSVPEHWYLIGSLAAQLSDQTVMSKDLVVLTLKAARVQFQHSRDASVRNPPPTAPEVEPALRRRRPHRSRASDQAHRIRHTGSLRAITS